MKETVLLGLLFAWEEHRQVTLSSSSRPFWNWTPLNFNIIGSSAERTPLKVPKSKQKNKTTTSSYFFFAHVICKLLSNGFSMLWRGKNISYFLVWTFAHFPSLNIWRCSCCAVGSQLYLAPAFLGLSALPEFCLFSAYGNGQLLKQRCITLEWRHKRTAGTSKGNLQLVTT